MKTLLIIITIFCSLGTNAQKQESFKSYDELKGFSDSIMSTMKNEEFEKMFSDLESKLSLTNDEFKNFKNKTALQFGLLKKQYGKIINYEYIKPTKLSTFAINHYYVLRFEKWMLRIKFKYYKTGDEWYLSGFEWDDKVEELYE